MAKAQKKQEQEQVQDQVADQQAPESISLNDLQLLLQIVDLASTRGAFRGVELTQVGTIFDKLNVFLSYIAEQQAAAAEQQEQSEE